MSNDTLPPLPPMPEPEIIGAGLLAYAEPERRKHFTADQLRAYGAECYRLATERAARIAEDMEPIAGATVHDIARAIRAGKGETE